MADDAPGLDQQIPLVRDSRTNQYINQLGRQIAHQAAPRGIPYTFYVVNSDLLNAFSIPGGYVYVNRGIFERPTTSRCWPRSWGTRSVTSWSGTAPPRLTTPRPSARLITTRSPT